MSYTTNCLTLVFNESLQTFMPAVTYLAQMLLPVPDKGLYSLPLPGQAKTPAGAYSLWQHRALPDDGPTCSAVNYYGYAHEASCTFLVLGTSSEVQKELQNLVLVTDGPDPVSLSVTTPAQGSFTQILVGISSANHSVLTRNLQRKSDTTYLVVQAPAALPWGHRARGKWLRLKLVLSPASGYGNDTLPRAQTRLLKTQTLVRDVFD